MATVHLYRQPRLLGTPSNTELRSLLNNLIQTCRDGQEGYLTAAENVEGDVLKRFSTNVPCNEQSSQESFSPWPTASATAIPKTLVVSQAPCIAVGLT
jgi:hypothetical protein